jgi:hypothetical protein
MITESTLEIKVAGTFYRKGVIKQMVNNEYNNVVELKPEPTNKFDPNAIKVVVDKKYHIGYIPKTICDDLTSFMNDSAIENITISELEYINNNYNIIITIQFKI